MGMAFGTPLEVCVNDGDLDLVVAPVTGPILVYVDNSKKDRIAFELRDHLGNRFGIGSKVIIHYGPTGRVIRCGKYRRAAGSSPSTPRSPTSERDPRRLFCRLDTSSTDLGPRQRVNRS